MLVDNNALISSASQTWPSNSSLSWISTTIWESSFEIMLSFSLVDQQWWSRHSTAVGLGDLNWPWQEVS